MVLAGSVDEITIAFKILDTIRSSRVNNVQFIQIKSTDCINELFLKVAKLYEYDPEYFELLLQTQNGDTTVLNNFKASPFTALGYPFKTDGTNTNVTLAISRSCTMHKSHNYILDKTTATAAVSIDVAGNTGSPGWSAQVGVGGAVAVGVSQGGSSVDVDDMSLGASASPTADGGDGGPSSDGDDAEASTSCKERGMGGPAGISRYFETDTKHYVGLVNQAMTCYLNSLLQALFNTPEFRNALYKWEYDQKVPEKKSIPFQLQKLFVSLQTSNRSAVETTDLTQSFGWGLQNAWEQHDIQELCRVMFDALECTFRDTSQANLINDLYEGKMLDYVKCLECGREKSREDTFLDIPLPVRPFASTEAYHSIEEALRAFVQPETLDGNNQYHCENCDKKCDAHKGLKFIKLPYLLTLHLKRFDFDYSTLHRIKLNDKVVFKQKLNLNSFVTGAKVLSEELSEERDNTVKCDDCSTTDYGSALDDESCQGTDLSSSANCPFDNYQDDDEGIDVSSGNNSHENEKNRRLQDPKGPYLYELFSIMIHSGSASGGHYYAYIKDFDKDNWYCYNDTTVNTITDEDIRKTYGGGPSRSSGYYSGAYTSSTNAYMLMYRQVDGARNAHALTVDQFPDHIAQIAREIRAKEESDRIAREQESSLHKIKVFCYHPSTPHRLYTQLAETRPCVSDDNTLTDIGRDAYAKFELDTYGIRADDCRLVTYNRTQDAIVRSWRKPDEVLFGDVESEANGGEGGVFRLASGDYCTGGWFLEIRERGKDWIPYDASDVNIYVYLINLDTVQVDHHEIIRIPRKITVKQLQSHLADRYPNLQSSIDMALKCNNNPLEYISRQNDDDGNITMLNLDLNMSFKLFVSQYKEPERNTKTSKLYQLVVEKFEHLISVVILYPETTIGMLTDLTIPSLDMDQNFDRFIDMGAAGDRNSPQLQSSPQSGAGPVNGSIITGTASVAVAIPSTDTFGDHSNSEDSSLSDSDRTLVGDAPGDCFAMLSSNSNSMPDVQLSSPTSASDNIVDEPPSNPDLFDKKIRNDKDYEDQVFEHGMHPIFDIGEAKPTVVALRDYRLYFKAEVLPAQHLDMIQASSSTENTCGVIMRCCRILADKRMSLRTFKQILSPIIYVPEDYFKLFRKQQQQIGITSNQSNEMEWSNQYERLEINSSESERLCVKLGRNIRDGEFAVSIHFLVLDLPEPSTLLFDWIIGNGQLVSAVKKDILHHVKKHHMLDIPYNRARLRKKSYKNPQKVYLDWQKFGEDIPFRHNQNHEIFLEKLPEDETMTSAQHISIFLRRWSPALYQLGAVHQTTISPPQSSTNHNQSQSASSNQSQQQQQQQPSLESVRNTVSAVSGIPSTELELAQVRTAFPSDMNAADVQAELEWYPATLDQDAGIYDDGAMFFYRDHREDVKQLTPDERKDLYQKENVRLGTSNAARFKHTLRRKERALKIYLPGTSPSNSRDESMNVD